MSPTWTVLYFAAMGTVIGAGLWFLWTLAS